MRTSALVLLATLVLVGSTPGVAAKPSLAVVEKPDVVVTNPSENMTRENFNPEYVFSPVVRVTNDDDAREINLDGIVYTDGDVTGCPRDERAFPVSFILKHRELEAGQTMRIGGAAHPQDAGPEEYWPLAVARSYRDARTNDTVEVSEGEHTFCANVRVTGDDPACDKPADRTCVIASEPFRTYVRRTNAKPVITEFSASTTSPRPGEQVLLQADATDEDTEPRPDSLRFTWDVPGEDKTGKTVRHSFSLQGETTVTLSVTDGFDTVRREMTLTVGTSGNGDDGPSPTPGVPGTAVLVLASALALVARRRR